MLSCVSATAAKSFRGRSEISKGRGVRVTPAMGSSEGSSLLSGSADSRWKAWRREEKA